MRRILITTTALMTAGLAVAQTTPPPAPPTPAAASAATAPAAAPTAPAATAAPAAAAPAAPPPPPLPSDPRDRVQSVCMAAAREKAKEKGVAEVELIEVKDTDVKSGGFASMRAKVQLLAVDSKGKTKKKKGTFGCSTTNDVVTSFKFD